MSRRRTRWQSARIAPLHNLLQLDALESRVLLDGLNGAAPLPAGASPVPVLPNLLLYTSVSSAGPLAAPGNLMATPAAGAIALNWIDQSNNENSFKVYRSTDANSFTQIASVNRNQTTYTDTAVTAGVTYYYKIAAYNSSTTSYSGVTSANAPLVTMPAAPVNLTISGATTNSLSLTWTDASNNESGFNLYRSTDGENFAFLTSLPAGSTNVISASLAAGTKYYYAVGAWNSAGENTSAIVAGTTNVLVTAPVKPSNLTTTGVTSSAVSLNWTDAANNESGFHVYRSADNVSYSLLASLAANTAAYTDSGLSAGTIYYYKVGAWNSVGEGLTAAVSVTTAVPPPPPGVTITTVAMVGFNALRIDGSTGNDSILVTQSGSSLTITANGQASTYSGGFGNLVIHSGSGNDTVTVDPSVNIPALVYADAGGDVIRNLTTGKPTIVTLGAGSNSTVTGNGINTAYWVNTGDTVNSTTAETNLGGVNRVSGFYQPWSSSSSNPDYVPLTLAGQNLRDPSDAGTEKRLTANSFWGLGPTMSDINQTTLSDCYFLAPLSGLARSEPQRLMNMGVDLGDGTYAVRFVRGGVTTYVRVDGDLSAGGWAFGLANQAPGTNGNLWGSIFEKAYAFFRSGNNSFSSLNLGYQATTFSDLGITNGQTSAGGGATATMDLINTQLNAGHAIATNTNSSISGGAPVLGSHVYSVVAAYKDSSGTVWIQVRNPWGVDGAGSDGVNDGLVTLTYAQYAANFQLITYATI